MARKFNWRIEAIEAIERKLLHQQLSADEFNKLQEELKRLKAEIHGVDGE